MEKKNKLEIRIFIIIGILITAINFSNLIDNGSLYDKIKQQNTIDNLKMPNKSSVWEVNYIHINNNWSDTAYNFNWVQGGDGSLLDPYIIENVKIDAQGIGSGIIIENSIDYFIIRNCIVFNSGNSGYDAGIKLINVRNSQIINNNCSLNQYGIILYEKCINNQIVNNILNNNTHSGIYIYKCDDNIITGNTADFNDEFGIWLRFSNCNTIENNLANKNKKNGIFVQFCTSSYFIGNELNENIQEHGIKLDNSNYSLLEMNTMNKNKLNGILLETSHNNIIDQNIAIDNDWDGIKITSSNNNWLKNNIVNKSDLNGIFFSNSHYNVIDGTIGIDNGHNAICLVNSNNNTVKKTVGKNNSHNGIYLGGTHENLLESNELCENMQSGIRLFGICSENSIERNLLYNNLEDGISIESTCIDNVFYGNLIKNNTIYGVDAALGTTNNLFHENSFIENTENALDNIVNTNHWNSSVKGNYWDDYTGSDSNDDGIGETDYLVDTGVYDYLPICDNKAPVIIVNSPNNNDSFGYDAPTFNITIIDDNLYFMWYNLGEGTANHTFTENETINQLAWESVPSGDVNLKFYAMDIADNIGFTDVNLYKDALSPQIEILSPIIYQQFGNTPPSFNIGINETNLDSTWYTIDGGNTNITFTGLSGVINKSVWSSALYGSITITFYANDTLRNLGYNSTIIIKIIPAPKQNYILTGILIGVGISSVVFISIIVLILKRKRG